MALTDNLVAYWKLDGNSVSSVGSNTGTDTAVSYVAGKINLAASMNGSSSKIALSAVAIPGANFTFSYWVNMNSLSGFQFVFSNGSQSNAGRAGFNGSSIVYTRDNIADYSLGGSVSTGVWTHIAVTANAGTVTGYVNGSAASSVSGVGSTSPSGTAFIGASTGGSSGFMNGKVDELGVWSRSLSAAEITALYNGGMGISYPFASFYDRRMLLI